MITYVLQDAKHAVRLLLNSPTFAVVAILTIALAVGLNTAMFALFDAVVVRLLPVHRPDQLFLLNEVSARGHSPTMLSWPEFERFRRSVPTGAQMAALAGPARLSIVNSVGVPEPISVQLVSGEYFDVLGVRPASGRLLSHEDNLSPNSSRVAVLSRNAWDSRFAGDRGIVGRTITINGVALTVVGVAEAGFYGVSLGQPVDVWVPTMIQSDIRYVHNVMSINGDVSKPWSHQERVYWLQAFVRLSPTVTVDRVVDSLRAVFQHEQELAGQAGARRSLMLAPGAQGFTGMRTRLASTLKVLLGMAMVVLTIACCNLTNLLLARARARSGELAIRRALGASSAHLLRQLITENLVLAGFGGCVGIVFAFWALPTLPRLFGLSLVPQLDYRILLFAAVLTVGVGLLLGTVPALRTHTWDLNDVLKSGAPNGSRRPRQLLGNVLVVMQIALSFSLATGAILLGRSLTHLLETELGFTRDNLITVVIDTHSAEVPPEHLPDFYKRILNRVTSIAGVRQAAVALSSLAGGGERSSDIYVPGYIPQPNERARAFENFVSSGYMSTVGMRLVDGRDFDERDILEAPAVAIVNEAFARRYLVGRSAVGSTFTKSGITIIGVVADSKTVSPREPPRPMVYYPLAQHVQHARSLEVRVERDPAALMPQLRRAISEVAPNLPILDVSLITDRIERTLNRERMLGTLTTMFAIFALLLASMGVYAIAAYAVARRTIEFGVRLALGASKGALLRMVMRESLLLLGIGLTVGLAISAAMATVVQALLFGVSSHNPLIVLSAAVVTSAVVIVGAYVPARRITAMDPSSALRHQ